MSAIRANIRIIDSITYSPNQRLSVLSTYTKLDSPLRNRNWEEARIYGPH